MSTQSQVFNTVLSITEDYLGPAAPRFISRLVEYHLHKEASDITINDLPDLIIWIQLAVTVMTDDRQLIDEYVGRLNELVRTRSSWPSVRKDSMGMARRPKLRRQTSV